MQQWNDIAIRVEEEKVMMRMMTQYDEIELTFELDW